MAAPQHIVVMCSGVTCDRCIFLEDVMRFMHKDEALKTIRLFGAETDHDGISKASLRNWVVILNALTINALLVHLPCSYQFLLLIKQQLKL